MQLLVPAASATLITAIALSMTAAVPAAGTRSSPAGQAQVGSAQISSVGVSPAGPALPTGADGTERLTGADVSAARSTALAPRRGFTWPLSPRPTVLRRFEQPRSQWSRGHRGVDLQAAVGQPVLSSREGVVAYSGVIAGRGVITVRHPGGLRTTYEPVDERRASGSLVRQGARIGVVSPTSGHCVPLTCVHWGAIAGATYRDPLSLLGFGRPILLPLG